MIVNSFLKNRRNWPQSQIRSVPFSSKTAKKGTISTFVDFIDLHTFFKCCIDDSPDILKLLIKYGANVNVCDNDMWTPLHAAATCANLEICKILILNKAELLAVNTDGNMPYDICDDEVCLEYIESEMANRGVTQQTIDIKRAEIEIKMLEDIKLMSFKGTDLNKTKPDQNGATFMHIACANGYSSVLEFLLEHKVSLSVQDKDGWTPLHVATFWGHVSSLLCQNGYLVGLCNLAPICSTISIQSNSYLQQPIIIYSSLFMI